MKARRKARYWLNRDKSLAEVKAWRERNREKMALLQRKYDFKRPNKTERLKDSRRRHLRGTYGLTEEQFKQLGDRCQICGSTKGRPRSNGTNDSLVVDHCHDTGRVMGLLCHQCNTGIGHFYHDTQLIANALQYVLKTHKRKEIA